MSAQIQKPLHYDNHQPAGMISIIVGLTGFVEIAVKLLRMEPHYYNIDVTWNSERKGIMCSPELQSGTAQGGCIEVATPPQFPKGVEGIWSPEHLFTAAIASCFMTTFLAIAENSKLRFTEFSCAAKGKLDKTENHPMAMTEVTLFPSVTLYDESDRDRALRVLEKSENACLITNSVKSRVTMQPSVKSLVEPARK